MTTPTDTTKVLVVTDDPQVRDATTYGFPSGVDILTARDARDAWRILADVVPSVVIVDMQTGSAGGFSLAKDMAHADRLASVPLFILLERDQDAWLARQAGARLYRTKPVEMDQLVSDALSLLG